MLSKAKHWREAPKYSASSPVKPRFSLWHQALQQLAGSDATGLARFEKSRHIDGAIVCNRFADCQVTLSPLSASSRHRRVVKADASPRVGDADRSSVSRGHQQRP